MLIVGLTGGIGSGKSIVAGCFQDLGARLVYADALAKDIILTDQGVRREFIREFGSEYFLTSDTLDRKRLARLVFGDPRSLRKLDAIVHPAVIAIIRTEINASKHERGILVIEAALFYETGIDQLTDYMIVVDAEEEVRIRRVMARDGCPREDVIKRMRMQMPADKKVRRADFVIVNSGAQSLLPAKCRFIYGILNNLESTRRGIPS